MGQCALLRQSDGKTERTKNGYYACRFDAKLTENRDDNHRQYQIPDDVGKERRQRVIDTRLFSNVFRVVLTAHGASIQPTIKIIKAPITSNA